ncbi:hypothetical protein GP486_000409 [Trichoglossum hirsutum]|uniref:Transcription factor domain-containing protein n=1 Tax=Trichoglossum hirsutum TaxID=265104 RepID=A0A9P8LIV1_9PEZI|nr:hypothetical protein GP486_000409 [Trichoglossum hirsutum]
MSPNLPFGDKAFGDLLRQIHVDPTLMVFFYWRTLSIWDGPKENPWKALVWPLVRESPALCCAVSSMAASHIFRERVSCFVDISVHKVASIQALANEQESVRTDLALATLLALAFSESWGQPTIGFGCIRLAKTFAKQALATCKYNSVSKDDYARLKFLCITFVYMDVISRLASDDGGSNNGDPIIQKCCGFVGKETEMDPLMGCATTLFPLIGDVAGLAWQSWGDTVPRSG